MNILKKEYNGEDLYDLESDLVKALGNIYESDPDSIYDSDGLLKVSFNVSVEVLR